MMERHRCLVFCFVIVIFVVPALSAPRSRNKSLPQTVFDQKQTGDYNIQLHLKDFQIIALLADDSIGDLGDYDYNYDYSDFTIKPSGSTTSKPNISEAINENTTKPNGHPYPIVLPTETTTEKIILEIKPSSTSQKPEEKTTSVAVSVSTEKIEAVVPEEIAAPENGKIKVQILETPVSPPVGIVPGEELGESNENLPLGDITPLRRCSTGFARDKKGRCRRVRRPGNIPFGIGRLASNLAARFRYASGDNLASSPESDSLDV